MRWPDARRGATRCLVMGLLAVAGCGREDVPADAAPLRSGSAALESGPDLVVTQVRGPASVRTGQGFTATVRVCNQGTESTNGYYPQARLELLLSMDTELTLPDPSMPSPGMPEDQQVIGELDLEPLYAGQCVTKSVSAYAHLPSAAQGNNGAYYLAAAIDVNHAEQELREDNNVHVGGLMGVGYRSDLVVTEVSAPPSARPSQDFMASVKVCNQGTESTGSSSYPGQPRVELFLSMDTELTLPDPSLPDPDVPMDQVSIGEVELDQPLHVGQCVTRNVYAHPHVPPEAQMDGAYYLVAAVDTNHSEQELREDNNVYVHGLMGVGHRADLVVTELSGPTSVRYGQGFMASAKVCNQGTLPTNGDTHLQLFLSMDTELTLPEPSMPYPGVPANDQAPVGDVNLSQILQPGQCVTKNVLASADLPPEVQGEGAFYLAAFVDSTHIEQELREDNNVRMGGLVGVGYRPDLVVTGLSGPASLSYGQHFMATVKVCNQGTSSTNGYYPQARLELFLSTDSELTLPGESMPSPGMPEEQLSIGEVVLDAPLYEGQCVTRSVPANAWLPSAAQGAGAYYLAAIVDTDNAEPELREDNNVHVGGLVGVGSRSDLVVTELSAPGSVGNGESFTASVKVCNQGTESTGSGGYPSYGMPRVDLFLSLDSELVLPGPSMPYPGSPDDLQLLGYVELNQALQPGQCVTQSVFAHASPPPNAQGDGAYYLGAVVDTGNVEQELREDNNVLVKGLMGVGNRPDLVVSEISAPASVGHDQPFTASVKVCNQGTTPLQGYAGPSLVELFLSVDATISVPPMGSPPPETPMDQMSIGFVELTEPLNPAQCVTKDVPAHANLPPAAQGDGAYYLAAAIDTGHAEQELREDNNVHVKGLMGVGALPDLVVTEVSAPASLHRGQDFTASVKVCNQGTTASMDTAWLTVVLSTDAQLSLPNPGSPPPAEQMMIGSIDVAPLPAGQCVTQDIPAYASLPAGASTPGVFHLGAIIDTNHWVHELREDNNTRAENTLEVTD